MALVSCGQPWNGQVLNVEVPDFSSIVPEVCVSRDLN